MTFNIENSKYMTITQKKQGTTSHSTVYKGSFKQTTKYKYLGGYMSEKGINNLNIKNKKI